MLKTYARMIKVSHTIFALPFALAASVLAWRIEGFSWVQLVLIVLCMLFARSSAMGFNRVVDRDIDAANPRTVGRELPSGALGVGYARGLVPAHTPMDGDLIFALSTGAMPLENPVADTLTLGHAAATCMARAIARAVHAATAAPNDTQPTWASRFGA